MLKISFSFIFLFTLSLPLAYAGCYGKDNLAYYWGSPGAKIDVSYWQDTIKTDTPANTRIGTMSLEFSCPYSAAGLYWSNDNKMGGEGGTINVALPEFNYINRSRMEHKSGWIYIAPVNMYGGFYSGNGNSWNFPHIGFAPFGEAWGGAGNSAQHSSPITYGIYTLKKMPGTINNTTQIISMLTSETGNKIVYRSGGLRPGNNSITPTVIGNTYTLKYINTVTCSVSSSANNIDLGVVNPLGDLSKPLATIVLTLRCGLGTGGGNMTSNYPSFIIPGSVRMNSVTSPNATSEWLSSTKSVGFRIGNGWGFRLATGDANLNINTLNNINIPIYPYKYGASQGNSAYWSGAVNFEIVYN